MGNRRDFIKKAGIITACTCMGATSISGCAMSMGVSKTPVLLSEAFKHEGNMLKIFVGNDPNLQTIGGAVKIELAVQSSEEPKKLIVIHAAENQFKVFEDKCTHGGRELNYKHDENQLLCSSFGHSKFDMEGNVLGGPAKGKLAVAEYTVDGNEITISL